MSRSSDSIEEIIGLWRAVPKPPEESEPTGVIAEEVAAFGERIGLEVPAELELWLETCNGTLAGPGGVYGISTNKDFLDIEKQYELYPTWRANKWIPVAGDGLGNRYVVDLSRTWIDADAVYFVETGVEVDVLSYVVGSDLLKFLAFLFREEAEKRGWPFRSDYVLGRDPVLSSIKRRDLLPWNA